MRYLWELHDDNIHDWQARFGFGPGRTDATRSSAGSPASAGSSPGGTAGTSTDDVWGQRDGERRRAIDFAVHNADNVLGWCTLAMVQDRCPHTRRLEGRGRRLGRPAEKSGLRLPGPVRTGPLPGQRRARGAGPAKYQALFQAALKEGVLPPLDSSFRSVLEGGKQDIWAKLMRETAARVRQKKARPVIVTLAWQCYQLGDAAMADTLLDQALANVPADEKAYTGIAAVHFLNADRPVRPGRPGGPRPLGPTRSWPSRLASGGWRRRRPTTGRTRSGPSSAWSGPWTSSTPPSSPEVFDVQPIRNDYGRLLSHYEWLRRRRGVAQGRPAEGPAPAGGEGGRPLAAPRPGGDRGAQPRRGHPAEGRRAGGGRPGLGVRDDARWP